MAIDLILGLGNPGEEYAATRHNIGFQVVEELKRRHARGRWVRRSVCDVVVVDTVRLVILARPLTFMNRSGDAVEWLLNQFSLHPHQMMVVVDDVDLSVGRLRLRKSGGPGTHNGMRDICRTLGTAFPRLRIGIRGQEVKGSLADYVLSPFSEDEIEKVEQTVHQAADAVEASLALGLTHAMNEFNQR